MYIATDSSAQTLCNLFFFYSNLDFIIVLLVSFAEEMRKITSFARAYELPNARVIKITSKKILGLYKQFDDAH